MSTDIAKVKKNITVRAKNKSKYYKYQRKRKSVIHLQARDLSLKAF